MAATWRGDIALSLPLEYNDIPFDFNLQPKSPLFVGQDTRHTGEITWTF